MVKLAFLFVTVMLVSPVVYGNEPTEPVEPVDDPELNYCKDEQKNKHWVKLLAANPDSPLVVKLFALRSGLCVMIEAGLVSLDDAITYFDEEKQKLLHQHELDKHNQNPELLG